jgi:hypothetical protein
MVEDEGKEEGEKKDSRGMELEEVQGSKTKVKFHWQSTTKYDSKTGVISRKVQVKT